MLMGVLAGLIEQDHLIDVRCPEPPQFLPDGLRRSDQTAAQCGLLRFRIFALPLVVFVPHVHGARCGTLTVLRSAVKTKRELKKRRSVGARPRLLVGLRAHEERHQRHVGVDLVFRELLQPLGDGIVIGVYPGVRGICADELKAERSKTVLTRALDGWKLRTRHPQRRMRFLHGLGHHIAQRNVEILAVMFAATLLEHREDGADCLLEYFLLGFHVAAERRQFGDRGALAHAEFDPAVAQEIENRDPLGDARRMIGRELENAVAEPDIPGALARGRQK